jgi:hypothetical protein
MKGLIRIGIKPVQITVEDLRTYFVKKYLSLSLFDWKHRIIVATG